MGKLVYLFELDSVNKSDNQMKKAMQALFMEIMANGNVVVVTFAQLIDSRFFMSLLNDEKWADCIMHLFQIGAIRISRYEEYRTPAQYLLTKIIDDKGEFIFSGIPVDAEYRELMLLLHRSLVYSDLTEIDEYLDGKRSLSELMSLFSKKNGQTTNMPIYQIRNTLTHLRAILRVVLRLSDICRQAYIPMKSGYCPDLVRFYEVIKESDKFVNVYNWRNAIEIVEASMKKAANKNSRSELLDKIMGSYQNRTDDERWMAEAIVNLCYNYACEYSIQDIAAHYDMREMAENSIGYNTFYTDFYTRFKKYYLNDRNKPKHLGAGHETMFSFFKFGDGGFWNLKNAMRLAEYASPYGENKHGSSIAPIFYEQDLWKQRIIHRFRITKGVLGKLVFAIFYLVTAFIVDNVLRERIEDKARGLFEGIIGDMLLNVVSGVISLFLAVFVVQMLSWLVSSLLRRVLLGKGKMDIDWEVTTFDRAFNNIIEIFMDLLCVLFVWVVPYYNIKNHVWLMMAFRKRS